MSALIQLSCFCVSIVYGFFINIIIRINKRLFFNTNIIYILLYRIIITFILVLLYIIIFYKINNGVFHIYFILFIILGYYIGNKIKIHM